MIRLSEYPLRQKGHDVDWENMPSEPCDMNFRPPRDFEEELVSTRNFLIVASVCSAVAVVVISVVNSLWPFLFSGVESIFLVVVAAAIPLGLMRIRKGYSSGRLLYLVLAGLLLATNLGTLFSGEARTNYYVTVFLFLILPFVLYVADAMASQFVHWASANPRLDISTMVSIRRIWNQRFSKGFFNVAKLKKEKLTGPENEIDEFLKAVACYPAYMIGLFSVFFLACVFAILISKPLLLAQTLIVLTSILSFGLAVAVNVVFPGSFKVAIDAITSFCVYRPIRKLPSMIQSPMPLQKRSNLLFSAVLVLSFAISSFWFSWGLFSITHVATTTDLILQIVLQFFVVFALSPVMLISMLVVTAGPTLWQFEKACESEEACLAREGWTAFDGYTDRLRNSRNTDEQASIWIGFHQTFGFPILVPSKLIGEHMQILGGSGAGKTGLGVTTLVGQLIKKNEGPVIVIDAKGDPALFQCAKQWTEEENRKFKWFTTASGKSTYVFNPFAQSHLKSHTLSELVGLQLLSMNLFHGSGYGRSWFTAASKAALTDALKGTKEKQPDSFVEFMRHLDAIVADDSEHASAKHLQFMMRTMAEFTQLNAIQDAKSSSEVINNAIQMDEVVNKNQVVYFSFESILDPMSTGEISRIVLYNAISAAKEYKERTGKPPVVSIVVDEAQNVIAANLEVVVEQARSHGVALVLCHHTREQLKKPGGDDLRHLVDSCTCVKQFFSARSPEAKKHLAEISGEVGYYSATWKQFVHRVLDGQVTMGRAVAFDSDPAMTDVSVQAGPRLTPNEIEDVSMSENGCILSINRRFGTAQFKGAFPIHVDYAISPDKYKNYMETRWPPRSDETLSPGSFWPESNEECLERESSAELPKVELPELIELNKKLQKKHDDEDYFPKNS